MKTKTNSKFVDEFKSLGPYRLFWEGRNFQNPVRSLRFRGLGSRGGRASLNAIYRQGVRIKGRSSQPSASSPPATLRLLRSGFEPLTQGFSVLCSNQLSYLNYFPKCVFSSSNSALPYQAVEELAQEPRAVQSLAGPRSSAYVCWGKRLKKMHLSEAIRVAMTNHRTNKRLLLALAEIWNPYTSTFVTAFGEITFTVEDAFMLGRLTKGLTLPIVLLEI
ncbi:hypothetical protein Syun_031921 [Stephania yunnanensis]|uniref:Aminotransferase-like plant mobile domain-containing protein n=1 Tax=Stephania yunnanensis TaxID=152371 RepID=A0AAP0E101_9MAGN